MSDFQKKLNKTSAGFAKFGCVYTLLTPLIILVLIWFASMCSCERQEPEKCEICTTYFKHTPTSAPKWLKTWEVCDPDEIKYLEENPVFTGIGWNITTCEPQQ